MQLKEIKNIFQKELRELYPPEEINSFFYILIEHFLNLERFVLALWPHLTVTKEEEQPLFEALSALKLQKPIQHITGVAHFMDLVLQVNEHVLIPRPETEELVSWVLSDLDKERPFQILDIGTGSGCIAISLAHNLRNSEVHAVDVSAEALKIAQENARKNKVGIGFVEADILETPDLGRSFTVIVSNPPYVRNLEKRQMCKNVIGYEPHLALFVSDKDPLLFYRHIAVFSQRHLEKGGFLYLEINQYLGKETVALLEENNFSEIELRKDMYGNDRMVKAVKK